MVAINMKLHFFYYYYLFVNIHLNSYRVSSSYNLVVTRFATMIVCFVGEILSPSRKKTHHHAHTTMWCMYTRVTLLVHLV